jgi:hypothetical protein
MCWSVKMTVARDTPIASGCLQWEGRPVAVWARDPRVAIPKTAQPIVKGRGQDEDGGGGCQDGYKQGRNG